MLLSWHLNVSMWGLEKIVQTCMTLCRSIFFLSIQGTTHAYERNGKVYCHAWAWRCTIRFINAAKDLKRKCIQQGWPRFGSIFRVFKCYAIYVRKSDFPMHETWKFSGWLFFNVETFNVPGAFRSSVDGPFTSFWKINLKLLRSVLTRLKLNKVLFPIPIPSNKCTAVERNNP